MRLSVATLCLTLHSAPSAIAQTCSGVFGRFTLTDMTGTCTYETLLDEYTRQVFDVVGATATCQEGGVPVSAKDDFDAKLIAATGATTGEEAAKIVCKALYDTADVTPFTKAADKGDDHHFEQMFYNGLSDWQDEVETIHETYDESATSVLRQDATKVREFYEGEGSYSRVSWPNELTNFDDATCVSHAAMCCWPKDRQANDANGNCAKPYDENCVDKDPADNTNLCYTDLARGNHSTGFDSEKGFAVFPEDNNDGEGAIHCHGFAWADDEDDTISRYKANNLFFVSMYDHMYQRGYVKNIPGAPMCGCMEQMPIATRSDCTQVDLTEDWEMAFDGEDFIPKMTKVEIDFNACQGRNNRNNDLWAYAARLYDDGRMTAQQFGKVGRVLTNDHDCYHAVENAKHEKGYVTGYDHNETMWTHVAGRDNMRRGEPFGREAFNKALELSLTETPIVHRICPDCIETHMNIYYRRLTPAPDGFDILNTILRHHTNSKPTGNAWNVDFTLHSTYEDATSGDNPWKCPGNNFKYKHAFTGACSPSGAQENDQYSNWWYFPGPRPNVAYYVNKPQAAGLTDYINDDSNRVTGETDSDIGNVGKAGNTLEHDGVYHITGAGSDIWGHADSFHYLSQPWGGDIDVKVHVTNFANNANDQWAKTGIMLRSDESPDATWVMNALTYTRGVQFLHRRSKGNHANRSDGDFKTNPVQTSAWLRLVKKMETIEFYVGDDQGENWVLHATDTILFPDDSYRVGLAITSHNPSYLAEATFENYEIAAYEFPTSAPSVSSAPTSWDPVDEIDTPRAGEYKYTNGVEEFKGSGSGIWGGADSFYFHNTQRANDDFSVEMFIVQFDSWQLNARGGLMIRDSNDPNAANVFVGAAGARQGAVFQSRAAAGEKTAHHKMIFANNDSRFYVKLDKVGSVVTASFRVSQADAWTELGSIELTLTGSMILVGRAVSAGNDYQHALETLQTEMYSITG